MEIIGGLLGKSLNFYHTVQPSVKVLMQSKKDDIILCWGAYAGVIVNFLSSFFLLNRNLIFPGWLTPVKHQRTYLLSKFAATKQALSDYYHITRIRGIVGKTFEY